MFAFLRRQLVLLLLTVITLTSFFQLFFATSNPQKQHHTDRLKRPGLLHPKFKWKDVPQQHPVTNFITLPTGPIRDIPKIQTEFKPETHKEKVTRQARLNAVKEAFLHSWEGYKRNAWLQDEVGPLSGLANNGFGGWGATLVDSLDTLWIMGFKREFTAALKDLAKIDFSSTPLDTLNVFETTIRYLGGFLSAYDISGHKHKILLKKAVELGEMLYKAFDTPNRMPVTRWDWRNAALGGSQRAEIDAMLADVGSLTVEFTRLSQLTGDNKWFDAVSRITNVIHERQNHTRLPGLLPQRLDAKNLNFRKDFTFTIGAMSDSFYEYLAKEYLMLGGRGDQYREMYMKALDSAKSHIFFKPLNPNNDDILVPGILNYISVFESTMVPEGQHLACFAGGMVAMAARIFEQPEELDTARQLVDGCLWAYESMPSGIMPERYRAVPCRDGGYNNCTWSQQHWYNAINEHVNWRASDWNGPAQPVDQVIMRDGLPPGMVEISDSRYNLRPEAIESMFVLYRITGDETLREKAWNMFQAINNATRTDIAYASVRDVRNAEPVLADSMESFWTAETLKYFYLIFSEPDVISLDEYVLNTEAHPLLRPK